MNIRIISVGKVHEQYIKRGIYEYINKISKYSNIEIVEVDDEKAPERLSKEEQNIVKLKEGNRILNSVRKGAFLIVLDIEGQVYTSEQFAEKVRGLLQQGTNDIDFVIGGSLGLHEYIITRAHVRISFSDFTFPHQLMRLILLEQIHTMVKAIYNT